VTRSVNRYSNEALTATASSLSRSWPSKTSVLRKAPTVAPTRNFSGASSTAGAPSFAGPCFPVQRWASPVGPTGGEMPQAWASAGTNDAAISKSPVSIGKENLIRRV